MIAAALALAWAADPGTGRTEEIWQYADARIARQVDGWFDLGDFPRTVQLLREQWAYSPHDYEVATNLGWMLQNMHQDDDALQVYGEYRAYNPRDLDGRLPEAELYASRRRFEKVIEVLAPVIGELDPKGRRPGTEDRPHANIFRLLAKSYERVGQAEKAIATWELQLRAYPGDLPAEANIRRVRAKMKATPPASAPVSAPTSAPGGNDGAKSGGGGGTKDAARG